MKDGIICNLLPIILIVLSEVPWTLCFIDPITLSIGGGLGAGLLGAGYQKYIKCKIYECCNDDYIPINVTELDRQLMTRLHGQHIAQRTVIRAIRGYKATANPPKALTMSFHGSGGTGKTFVSEMMSQSFYKEGKKSKFYHLFSGSTYSTSRLDDHKNHIRETIVESLIKCSRSMFVFDEMDSMPEGLLDVLLPFMDHGQPIFVEHKSETIRINSNKAIFIFLANAGGVRIISQMLKFWQEGRKRESLRLQDFENSISADALREAGGFLNSEIIKSSLIDHFVPFLPLEEQHVKLCVRDAFMKFITDEFQKEPTASMEQEVMSIVTYHPEPYNIYSYHGCKKLEQKVISTLHTDNMDNEIAT